MRLIFDACIIIPMPDMFVNEKFSFYAHFSAVLLSFSSPVSEKTKQSGSCGKKFIFSGRIRDFSSVIMLMCGQVSPAEKETEDSLPDQPFDSILCFHLDPQHVSDRLHPGVQFLPCGTGYDDGQAGRFI